jgi:hypothetical protein
MVHGSLSEYCSHIFIALKLHIVTAIGVAVTIGAIQKRNKE